MALRAVHDYEEAAVRDNSVRQVASEPYAYYAARDLQPGDEVTSAFGAGYWLTALERYEPRPATRLLLCIAKAQYARLSQGVDGVSACARLREATGDTITFVFSTKAQAILLRGGENGGGERQLGGENSGEGLGETGEILREMSELQAGLLLNYGSTYYGSTYYGRRAAASSASYYGSSYCGYTHSLWLCSLWQAGGVAPPLPYTKSTTYNRLLPGGPFHTRFLRQVSY